MSQFIPEIVVVLLKDKIRVYLGYLASIISQSLQFLNDYQEVKDDLVADNAGKQVGEMRLKLQIQNS